MRKVPVALVAALLAAPAVARADGGGTNYRAEIGVIDGATTALALGYTVGVSDDASVVPIFALTGIAVLAGPLDHAGRGNYGRAGISLGAHVLLPTLGGAIGAGSADGKGFDGLINIFAGILVGHLAAIGADIYLAKTEGTPDTATPRMLSFGGSF